MSDVRSHMDMMSAFMLAGTGFAPGWFIGSERDDGASERGTAGWPYTIYRKTVHIGGTDQCLCIGIQSLGDADRLCEMLNRAAGIEDHSPELRHAP